MAAFIPEVLEARLEGGLEASTGYTIVVPKVLVAEVRRVREQGFARSVDETEFGLSSLAVPVHAPPDGQVVAAISMVGPTLASSVSTNPATSSCCRRERRS